MLVPYYLMYSYLYYEKNETIVSDDVYDKLCKKLYDEWDNVKHFHKYLIDKETLTAGTGFSLKYPLRVQEAALLLLKDNNK